MKQPAAIIYLITNLVNGKTYVGLTRFTLQKRWREHRYHAKSGLKTYFYAALRKYGSENFSVAPIASCLDVSNASEVERLVIKTFQPEYNQTNGGEFTAGKRVSPEVVERIRAKNTGLKRTPEQNKASSELRKKLYADNPELKQVIATHLQSARRCIDQDKRIAAVRAALKGKPVKPEARAKQSASCMGRRYDRSVIDRMARKHDKPVECITLGVTFDSVSEAAKHLGLGISCISKACIGKTQRTAGGMRFQYI